MTVSVAINGFGRMGRLAFRAAWDRFDYSIVHINECQGDIETAAHLLKYDSVHGTWDKNITVEGDELIIDGKKISYSQNRAISETNWQVKNIDVVVECTGAHRTPELLAPYFEVGVKKVVVSAPVKQGAVNIVMGINQQEYVADRDAIITAASCTTNCLAPVVDVIHNTFGIKHGCITTIHDLTNTQSIIDEYHKDLRRARACGSSLIPTSTGSATAITAIFPELTGRLDGIAVRVPLTNASLTDCVFELDNAVSVDGVNQALSEAAEGRLQGILGYEEKPLVSVDYTNDVRSSIVDALSTRVINNTQVKILAWYDNEIGYVNRMMELVDYVVAQGL